MRCSFTDSGRQVSLVTSLQAALVFSILMICPAWAQLGNFEDLLETKPRPGKSAKAVFTATLEPAAAKPGDEVILTVSAKLPPKSYIYATTGEFEQRTRITTKKIVGLAAVDSEFQPDRQPETAPDPIFNQVISKFHGDVSWSKKFKVEAAADPASVAVDLQLEGQYCSEGAGGSCTPIRGVDLHASLEKSTRDAKPAEESAVKFWYRDRPIKGNSNPVEFEYQLAPKKDSAGKIVVLAITMHLDKGWHTFPTYEGSGGQPTSFDLKTVYGLKPIGEEFKPNRDVEHKQEGEDKLQIYHDQVTWTQEFEVLPDGRPNAYGIEGGIKYQVCSTSCIPKNTKFSLGVTSDEIQPPATVEAYEEVAAPAEAVAQPRPQDKGLILFLLTAVGAGLVALVTPCVFPMVPITVSFFLKQNESTGTRPIALALVFSASIVAAFVVIGVGIAAIFGATKPNELANNWILNLFLASVFFTFALNMLGLFEIQVPSWLVSMTSTGEQAGGYLGVIFMALTFVLTSFSCTFAFVGSLLAAAAQGEYYWPVLGMLAFGATFATPFFALAMAPGMLKSLPKSGGWLNAVKVVMGFVEVGVAVKYISIVDQQWNAVPWIFDFTNVMTLWSVLSICTGLYLLGQFRLTHDSPVQGLSPLRVLLSVGFLLLGGLFAVGMANPDRESWFVDQLVAFAPARVTESEFETDFDVAVLNATASNKPLFLDFTGVFCTNCRLMEKRMAKPHNHRRLERFVQAQLYADKVPNKPDKAEADRILARNIALQTEWFGDVTLPAYAVVTPDGKTILSKFLGLEATEGDFAKFLDDGYRKWDAMK